MISKTIGIMGFSLFSDKAMLGMPEIFLLVFFVHHFCGWNLKSVLLAMGMGSGMVVKIGMFWVKDCVTDMLFVEFLPDDREDVDSCWARSWARWKEVLPRQHGRFVPRTAVFLMVQPPIIKHGKGKSPIYRFFSRFFRMFNCYVWLPWSVPLFTLPKIEMWNPGPSVSGLSVGFHRADDHVAWLRMTVVPLAQ